MRKWSEPAEIKKSMTSMLLPKGKSKEINVMYLKKVIAPQTDSKEQPNKDTPEQLDFPADGKLSRLITRPVTKINGS
jgi:hypothetical protein